MCQPPPATAPAAASGRLQSRVWRVAAGLGGCPVAPQPTHPQVPALVGWPATHPGRAVCDAACCKWVGSSLWWSACKQRRGSDEEEPVARCRSDGCGAALSGASHCGQLVGCNHALSLTTHRQAGRNMLVRRHRRTSSAPMQAHCVLHVVLKLEQRTPLTRRCARRASRCNHVTRCIVHSSCTGECLRSRMVLAAAAATRACKITG